MAVGLQGSVTVSARLGSAGFGRKSRIVVGIQASHTLDDGVLHVNGSALHGAGGILGGMLDAAINGLSSEVYPSINRGVATNGSRRLRVFVWHSGMLHACAQDKVYVDLDSRSKSGFNMPGAESVVCAGVGAGAPHLDPASLSLSPTLCDAAKARDQRGPN